MVKQPVYFGVLFGRSVTTKDIFADALSGLIERAHLFTVSIKALSHHNRVATVNVFITSKFSYLTNFFVEACAEGVVKAVIKGLILRYGGVGTAYPYEYLVVPPEVLLLL